MFFSYPSTSCLCFIAVSVICKTIYNIIIKCGYIILFLNLLSCSSLYIIQALVYCIRIVAHAVTRNSLTFGNKVNIVHAKRRKSKFSHIYGQKKKKGKMSTLNESPCTYPYRRYVDWYLPNSQGLHARALITFYIA